MAYINGNKVLFSAKVNIQDVQGVEVIKSGYDVSQTINDDDTCDLVITETGNTSSMITTIEKEVKENGIYKASDDGVVGYSSIKVNVAGVQPYNLTVGYYDADSMMAGSLKTKSQQCLAEQQIILYATVLNSNNTFDGWYQDGTLISANPIYTGFTMPSKDTTILAKMTKGSGSIL